MEVSADLLRFDYRKCVYVCVHACACVHVLVCACVPVHTLLDRKSVTSYEAVVFLEKEQKAVWPSQPHSWHSFTFTSAEWFCLIFACFVFVGGFSGSLSSSSWITRTALPTSVSDDL